jgi:hypothetical protein
MSVDATLAVWSGQRMASVEVRENPKSAVTRVRDERRT